MAEHSGTTSTGTILAATVTFPATYWRVANEGTIPLRVTFGSTAGTTGGYEVRPRDDKEFRLPGATNLFALLTTSTSTDGADHRRVRVLALGA